LTLELEATPDILADVARDKGDRILVGFAAETENVAEHARAKLQAKQADLIVANDVTADGAGFDHDTNVVTFYSNDAHETSLPRMRKLEVAGRILDFVLELRRARKTAPAAHGAR
jgi:phosphopantothenoylcysteine decarboxylase/phosphopantothenate--cysteine ligase